MVAKGYTQVYGLDYSDTFFLVAKMTIVRLFLVMVAIRHWPIYQLDIKNFQHDDLEEEEYMEQPVFYCLTYLGKCVYIIVYVDDIIITGNGDMKIC